MAAPRTLGKSKSEIRKDLDPRRTNALPGEADLVDPWDTIAEHMEAALARIEALEAEVAALKAR